MQPNRPSSHKIMSLAQLQQQAAEWRAADGGKLGITSGVFDIVHPGHISFLEDASRECGRLVVVIASDRTVRALKGEEKPYVNELKRAHVMAAMEMVDAVIISDELYHETILRALSPDVMFKGDDYAGKQIFGADLVGEVKLIPCNEKEFYSSSRFAQRIKEGRLDAWDQAAGLQ